LGPRARRSRVATPQQLDLQLDELPISRRPKGYMRPFLDRAALTRFEANRAMQYGWQSRSRCLQRCGTKLAIHAASFRRLACLGFVLLVLPAFLQSCWLRSSEKQFLSEKQAAQRSCSRLWRSEAFLTAPTALRSGFRQAQLAKQFYTNVCTYYDLGI